MAKQVNITSAAQLKNYDSDYSESGFWKVVAKISPTLARTALELYYVMKESSTPLATKGLIIAALGYLVCPVDLIPDLIPLLGWTDDAGALAFVYNQVKQHVTPEIKCHVDQKLGLNGAKKLPKSLIKLCSNAKTVRNLGLFDNLKTPTTMPYFQPWIGHNYQSSNPRILVVGDSHYCADPCELRSQCGVHGNLPASSMGRCQFFTQEVTSRYLDFRAGRAEAEGWMKRTILTFDKIFYGKDDVTSAETLDLWNRIAFYNFVQTATSSDPSNSNYTTDDYRRSTPHSAEVLESLQPDIILVWGSKAYDYLPSDGWSAINDVCGDYTLRSGRKARCIKLTHPSRASFASEHQKLTQCLNL